MKPGSERLKISDIWREYGDEGGRGTKGVGDEERGWRRKMGDQGVGRRGGRCRGTERGIARFD